MELREMTREERKHWFDAELAEAFLLAEIKPLADMERMTLQGIYLPLGLFEGDALLGYATFWQRPDVGYVVLDYLGVTREKRNSGLGSVILRLVAERLGVATAFWWSRRHFWKRTTAKTPCGPAASAFMSETATRNSISAACAG